MPRLRSESAGRDQPTHPRGARRRTDGSGSPSSGAGSGCRLPQSPSACSASSAPARSAATTPRSTRPRSASRSRRSSASGLRRASSSGSREIARETPEVAECHRITGEDCYLLRLHLRSIDELEEMLDRFTPHGLTTTSIVHSTPVPRRGRRSSAEAPSHNSDRVACVAGRDDDRRGEPAFGLVAADAPLPGAGGARRAGPGRVRVIGVTASSS